MGRVGYIMTDCGTTPYNNNDTECSPAFTGESNLFCQDRETRRVRLSGCKYVRWKDAPHFQNVLHVTCVMIVWDNICILYVSEVSTVFCYVASLFCIILSTALCCVMTAYCTAKQFTATLYHGDVLLNHTELFHYFIIMY